MLAALICYRKYGSKDIIAVPTIAKRFSFYLEVTGMRKKHFHLIGVCGTAMGSLAGMLKAQGHRVTGSDKAFYPPMGDEFTRSGRSLPPWAIEE